LPLATSNTQGPAGFTTCGGFVFSAAIFAAAAPGPFVLRRNIVIAAADA
jgi:hypothetical protein